MSELKNMCFTCCGTGVLNGIGFMPFKCPSCNGKGHIEEAKPAVTEVKPAVSMRTRMGRLPKAKE